MDKLFQLRAGMTMTTEKFQLLWRAAAQAGVAAHAARDGSGRLGAGCVRGSHAPRGRHLHKLTDMKNLVLAGGVALNCVGNGRILREGPFENIWIQPAAGDAGGALGVAQLIWHHVLDSPRKANKTDSQPGSMLGPRLGRDLLEFSTNRRDLSRYRRPGNLLDRVAEMMAQEKVVGWLQDRMEFGPRALGLARSSAMRAPHDAAGDEPQDQVPRVVPTFAPAVLRENASEYFDIPAPSRAPTCCWSPKSPSPSATTPAPHR